MAKKSDKNKNLFSHLDPFPEESDSKILSNYKAKLIRTNKLVSHKENFYNVKKIEELAEIITMYGGLEQPLKVVRSANGTYIITGGHRRFLACKLLKWKKIPCYVVEHEDTDDTDIELKLILSNAGNREKSAREKIEEVLRLDRIIDIRREQGKVKGKTNEVIAKMLGMTANAVYRIKKLKKLIPDLLSLVYEDQLGMYTAELFSLYSEENQQALFEYISKLDDNLTQKDGRELKKLLDKAIEDNIPFKVALNNVESYFNPTMPIEFNDNQEIDIVDYKDKSQSKVADVANAEEAKNEPQLEPEERNTSISVVESNSSITEDVPASDKATSKTTKTIVTETKKQVAPVSDVVQSPASEVQQRINELKKNIRYDKDFIDYVKVINENINILGTEGHCTFALEEIDSLQERLKKALGYANENFKVVVKGHLEGLLRLMDN